MWTAHSSQERHNAVKETGKWWPWNSPKVSIPFCHILKRSLRFATIPLPFRGIYQAGISAWVILQRGREARIEWGGRREGGWARMGGITEGVQSIWEVTVCNWELGKIYHEWTGKSVWAHAMNILSCCFLHDAKLHCSKVREHELEMSETLRVTKWWHSSQNTKILTGGEKRRWIDRCIQCR